mmetsp:Transcript_7029/g.24498  ORF Transcript_7029/g.24498 Transcript_7029/m.24498 type:complete len:325 (-) Transcript_7029:1609-2583(-)
MVSSFPSQRVPRQVERADATEGVEGDGGNEGHQADGPHPHPPQVHPVLSPVPRHGSREVHQTLVPHVVVRQVDLQLGVLRYALGPRLHRLRAQAVVVEQHALQDVRARHLLPGRVAGRERHGSGIEDGDAAPAGEVVVAQVKLLQVLAHADELGDLDRSLVADAVAGDPQLRHASVLLQRLRQDGRAFCPEAIEGELEPLAHAVGNEKVAEGVGVSGEEVHGREPDGIVRLTHPQPPADLALKQIHRLDLSKSSFPQSSSVALLPLLQTSRKPFHLLHRRVLRQLPLVEHDLLVRELVLELHPSLQLARPILSLRGDDDVHLLP